MKEERENIKREGVNPIMDHLTCFAFVGFPRGKLRIRKVSGIVCQEKNYINNHINIFLKNFINIILY